MTDSISTNPAARSYLVTASWRAAARWPDAGRAWIDAAAIALSERPRQAVDQVEAGPRSFGS